MEKNCPNCGAPYESNLNKCPYCRTSYFDMSAIDLEERKPIYLKLKIDGVIITQKCIPTIGEIEINNDPTEIIDCAGKVVCRMVSNRHLMTNITFEAVPDYKNGSLFTVERNV